MSIEIRMPSSAQPPPLPPKIPIRKAPAAQQRSGHGGGDSISDGDISPQLKMSTGTLRQKVVFLRQRHKAPFTTLQGSELQKDYAETLVSQKRIYANLDRNNARQIYSEGVLDGQELSTSGSREATRQRAEQRGAGISEDALYHEGAVDEYIRTSRMPISVFSVGKRTTFDRAHQALLRINENFQKVRDVQQKMRDEEMHYERTRKGLVDQAHHASDSNVESCFRKITELDEQHGALQEIYTNQINALDRSRKVLSLQERKARLDDREQECANAVIRHIKRQNQLGSNEPIYIVYGGIHDSIPMRIKAACPNVDMQDPFQFA